MNDKNGWIDQNTGDCLTDETVGGLITNTAVGEG